MPSRHPTPAFLLVLWMAASAACQQQPAAGFYVNDQDDVSGCRGMRRLLADEKRGPLPNLADAYQKILESASPAGVVAEKEEAEGQPYQLYLGVRAACRDRLARLSSDALKDYRASYDGIAQNQLRQALERRSLDALRELSAKWGATSIGGEALLSIAEMCLEEGDLEGAFVALDPLVRAPKQYVLAPARSREAVFLLAQCARGLGRWERLSALDRAAKEGDAALYEAPIQLGGTSLTLRDALHQLAAGAPAAVGKLADLAKAQPWTFRIPPPPAPEPIASQRQVMVIVGPGSFVRQEYLLWDPSIEAGLTPSCTGTSGAPWVFLHTGQQGVVLDARTGVSPGWEWSVSSLQTAADATSGASAKGRLTRRACLSGRRLYAALESGWAEYKTKEAAAEAGSKVLRCSLYAFDLDREGYRLWDTERLRLKDPSQANEGPESLREAAFVSPPTVSGGRVYAAAATLGKEIQLYLCAFDAETGETRWCTYLGAEDTGAANFQQIEMAQHKMPGLAPVVADGRVVYCSNWGVVTALDAGNGEVQWLVKYGRKRDLSLRGGPNADWAENPVQVQDGVVVVAPEDSDYLFTLDLARGVRLGNLFERAARGQQFRYVAALPRGRLALASDQTLWVTQMDEPTHQVIRPVKLMEPANGRPLVDGDDLYVPGAKALYRIRLAEATPKAEELLRWPEKASGGIDLVRTDAGLVALTRDRVYGYAR